MAKITDALLTTDIDFGNGDGANTNQDPVWAAGSAVVGTLGALPYDTALTPSPGDVATLNATSDGIAFVTPSGGGGTVTSVSVATANGVSGSVANPTTTPDITLTLGAITPSSVAAVGTVTGSNLSGTNTGDQTITLTGDVTGNGTGSFATTVAKLQSYTLDLSTPPTTGQVLGYNGTKFLAQTPAVGSITLSDASGSGVSTLVDPGTDTSFSFRPIQGGRGLSVTNGGTIISAATTANVHLGTDVQRTTVSATGSGTPADYNLQLSTLGASALSSSSMQIEFNSLLYLNVGASAGSNTLKIIMDGTTTLFTLNLTTGLTAYVSPYINFGFKAYISGASANSLYFVTYANSTSYSPSGFTASDVTQVHNVTSFNRNIAHTFQVVINMESVDVTASNVFSCLSNF